MATRTPKELPFVEIQGFQFFQERGSIKSGRILPRLGSRGVYPIKLGVIRKNLDTTRPQEAQGGPVPRGCTRFINFFILLQTGAKVLLIFENLFSHTRGVKFYNPRRYSRDHRLPSLARDPWPPFYYYKKVRCMRRMCRRTGLPLLEDLFFHTFSKSGCRALNSNVPRMCPNVPECATNVPPNVLTQTCSPQNHTFS